MPAPFVQPFAFEVPNYAPDEEMVLLAKGFEERGVDLDQAARIVLGDDAGQIVLEQVARMLVAVFLAADEHALDLDQHVTGSPFYLSRKPPG